MQRLPCLLAGSSSRGLPLPNWAAVEFAASVLEDDLSRRQERLTAILRDAPTLTLWCVCRIHRQGLTSVANVAEVAEWLAARGWRDLQWSASELAAADDLPDAERWSEQMSAAIAVARIAAQVAGVATADWAYLGGLLSQTSSWMRACSPISSAAASAELSACTPKWLADFLRELAARETEDSVILAVAEAVARVERVYSQPLPAEFQPDWDHAQRLRLRDKTDAGSDARLLPRLLRKLARLADLEADFHRTLETEKLAALRVWAYGASHEINNPLANISTRAQTLLREETEPERRRKLATINSQAFRAHEMISDMMLFARPPQLRPEAVDLGQLVQEVVEELAPDAEAQGTVLHHRRPEHVLLISADREYLSVALKSLGRNSLEALGRGGLIEIAIRETPPPAEALGDWPWVEIEVHDTGPGIADSVRRHLFDPYFSGREAGRGLGLGLSKCWRIVSEHGGRIDVRSELDRGATFVVRLPQQPGIPVHATATTS